MSTKRHKPRRPVLAPLRTKAQWKRRFSKGPFYRQMNLRYSHIDRSGFPIVTTEVADELVRVIGDRCVLEVGAGTGYLAKHLQDRGVNIHPIDSGKGDCTREEWWARKRYTKVHEVDVDDLPDFAGYDVILMSWPCYNTNFAMKVADKMSLGQLLIYQGESKGGCTGNYAFFDTLKEQFIEIENEILDDEHVQFFGIHDWWRLYRKVRRAAPDFLDDED